MKNIFIEGIQGAGKSTLLNNITAALPGLHPCREGDYSPVDLAWCTWMTKKEYKNALSSYKALENEIRQNTVEEHEHFVVSYTKIITDVPGFHKDLEKYEIYNGRKALHELKEIIFSRYKAFQEMGYVFECSFFQNIIEDLILFHQLSDDQIVEFYRELFSIVNKEQFLLLYLYSEKLEENINAIKKERSDDSGNELWYHLMLEYLIHSPYGESHRYNSFQDMIAHFHHRQQLELRIIKEVIGDKAIIIPSKGWEADSILPLTK